jgi:hypothetical protein
MGVGLLAALLPGAYAGARMDWDLSALVCAVILVAPHVHVQELVLLLVPAALLLREPGRSALLWRWGLFLLALLPVVPFVVAGQGGGFWPVLPVLLLVLYAACLFQRSRSGPGFPLEEDMTQTYSSQVR